MDTIFMDASSDRYYLSFFNNLYMTTIYGGFRLQITLNFVVSSSIFNLPKISVFVQNNLKPVVPSIH
jgi:hypothetical protein